MPQAGRGHDDIGAGSAEFFWPYIVEIDDWVMYRESNARAIGKSLNELATAVAGTEVYGDVVKFHSELKDKVPYK